MAYQREGERNTKGRREVNEGGRWSGQSSWGKGSEETVDFYHPSLCSTRDKGKSVGWKKLNDTERKVAPTRGRVRIAKNVAVYRIEGNTFH